MNGIEDKCGLLSVIAESPDVLQFIYKSFVTVLGRNLWFLPAEKIRAVDI